MHPLAPKIGRLIDFASNAPSRRMALSALHLIYPKYSLKRRTAFLLNLVNTLTLRLTPEARATLRGLDQHWLPLRALTDEFSAVLLHKVHQNGRAYFFHFSSTLELRSVTKLAITTQSIARLRQEHDALQHLSACRPNFLFPDILSFETSDQHAALHITAPPPHYRLHNKTFALPDSLYSAIAAIPTRTTPAAQLKPDSSWITQACRLLRNDAIRNLLPNSEQLAAPALCSAHGDLGSENIFSHYDQNINTHTFFLIDWESSSPHAPHMTDRVAYWLGQNHRRFKRRLFPWSIRQATSAFILQFQPPQADLSAAALALLYLSAFGNDLALILCKSSHELGA